MSLLTLSTLKYHRTFHSFHSQLVHSKRFSDIKSTDFSGKDAKMKTSMVSRKIYTTPKTVDFNVNGACNLNCTWCWGPDHKAKEELTNEQWKEIASKLKTLGTSNITFTGGETLMKEGLADILKYVHEDLSMRTTLSTNGILLKRKAKEVLPFVDDIGLPLDGHTREINNIMRAGTPKHFDRVLEAIRIVQDEYACIDLTVRTVLSAKNADSVPLIGKTLIESGIDPKKLRWRIYQVTPIGVRKDDVLNGDWLISSARFEEIMQKVRHLNGSFPHISTLATDKHVGRYFHIYPDGKTHIFFQGKDEFPTAFPTGNIGKNFDAVIENLRAVDLPGNEIR